jgi:hypothetical protein
MIMTFKILVGNPKERENLEVLCVDTWKDSIHMYLKELSCENVDRIHLAEGRGPVA